MFAKLFFFVAMIAMAYGSPKPGALIGAYTAPLAYSAPLTYASPYAYSAYSAYPYSYASPYAAYASPYAAYYYR